MPITAQERAKNARLRASGKWMAGAFAHNKGALHRYLGIPEDQTIPIERLKATIRGGGKWAKRAQAALTAGRISRKNAR